VAKTNEVVTMETEAQEQEVSTILVPLIKKKLFLSCSAAKSVSLSANVTALPDFLRSSGSGTGSTQPREDN
jgi:hypothetical protein